MDSEKKRHKAISKKLNMENIFIGITILLGVVLIFNIFLAYNLNKDIKKGAEAVQEKLKPAKIELALIKNSKCADCFDISAVAGHLKSANANVTKETTLEFTSKEAKELIKKYGIEKVPAAVVTGEIDKISLQGFEKNGDALLLSGINPPYTSTATGKIEGRVVLYHLKDAACGKCSDLSILISQIKSAGVKISQEKIIAPASNEGKDLIKKYSIGFAPSIILSKDASVYGIMQQAWPQIGTKESDGSYVLRAASPPFINLTTGKLRGIVNIVYLADKSCSDCYNVSQHKEILVNPQGIFRVNLEKEEIYDISDAKGKELIAKYNITQVPTVILSDEISAYPASIALKQFYSVEKDSFYVFRLLSVVGTYKDLSTSQIVKAQQIEQQQ